jgi:general stress protein YciG
MSEKKPDGRHGRSGFASMTPERRHEIAHMGGLAARDRGLTFTSETGREAGRKGGTRSKRGKAHRFTPDEARAAGRKSVETRRKRISYARRLEADNAED